MNYAVVKAQQREIEARNREATAYLVAAAAVVFGVCAAMLALVLYVTR